MATEQQIKDFLGECNCASEPIKYLVNHSLVGCLPDNDPAIFDDFESAKEYLIDLITSYIDDCDYDLEYNDYADKEATEAKAETFTHLREDANLMNEPGDLVGGGYHFWITEDSDSELSYEEFSHLRCDCCNGLPGARYEMVGYNPKTKEVEELGSICPECRYDLAYGGES